MTEKQRTTLFLAALFSALLLAYPTADAKNYGSGLLVTPTRLVFDGSESGKIFHLENRSDVPNTYRITWKNYEMTAKGNLAEISAPKGTIKFAQDYFRYSPRQVTLKPGESQTVRLAIRDFSKLEDGEYRSHMSFSAIPDAGSGVSEDDEPKKGVRIRMKTGVSFSFPVIIHKGDLQVKTSIKGVRLTKISDKEYEVISTLARDGNRSAQGNVEYIWVKPDGTEVPITQQRSVGVYLEVPERELRGTLPITSEVPLGSGQLKIRYVAHYTDPVQQPSEIVVPF